MSKVISSTEMDKIPKEEIPRYLTIVLADIVKQINGGLDFGTNFNASSVSAIFSSANTDTAISHGLGRVPAGYLVLGSSAAMQVYDGVTDDSNLLAYLRSSAVGTANILFF